MPENSSNNPYFNCPFRWAAFTDKGRLREQNEDSFLIEPETGIFLVSDGMGGHRGGELASKITTEDLSVLIETELHRLKTNSSKTIKRLLKKTIVEQNKQLCMEGKSESGYKEMGATLAIVLLSQSRAYLANLGDSRIYRFRNNKMLQMSKDHSVVSELLHKGQIDEQEAQNHEARGQITHYIGMEEKAKPYIRSFTLKKNDRLLLCSDGLTDMLADEEIAKIQNYTADPQTACQNLVNAANSAGGYDNITAVIVDWQGN